MKIAIDIRHLAAPHQAGVGHYTIELINEMVRLATDDHFFLFASGTHETLSNLPDFNASNVTVVKKALPNRLLFLLFLLKMRTIESFLPVRPDLLFLPNHTIVHTSLPYVLTVHDISFDIFPSFFTLKDRLRYRLGEVKKQTQRASHIFAVSESTKRDLMRRWSIDEGKITVTPLGVRRDYHPKQLPSDRSYLARHGLIHKGEASPLPYILTLCTREPRKNLEAVVEAYARWLNTLSPNAYRLSPCLVIAGGRGWKSKTLDRVIAHSDAKDRILVIGYVPNKHKPALYRHAKALIFPSFYEGFGLPAIEALASGTPVIASSAGSLPEVVSPHTILIDPFNVTDLAQALQLLNTKTVHDSKLLPWSTCARSTWRTLKELS